MTVTAGTLVSFEYTLKDEAGEQIESNVGGEALTYVHGLGQIVPGLEKALEGMQIGETKTVVVSPEEGYGQVDPQAVVEIPKDQVPKDAHQVGATIQARNEDGQMMIAQVSAIKDNTIIMDFNHPFAGQTLNFEIKVLEISVPEDQQN